MKTSKDNADFKTPEGYFEGFTDKLMDRISTQKDNQRDPLSSKSGGFIVPDAYFEGLNSKILKKLDQDETKVIPLNPRAKYLYYAAAIAAVVLLTIGIRYTQSAEPTFESLAKTEIEDYFEHTASGFSTYEIAEVIPVDDLEISDVLENEFEDENIIDYLDNSLDDFEELNLTDYEY